MGKKYMVKFDREGCIGAAACVSMDPTGWILDNSDGKAILVDGKWDENEAYWIKEIDEGELDSMLAAAKACPVVVIHIVDMQTGEQLI
jgi:ferredoxin